MITENNYLYLSKKTIMINKHIKTCYINPVAFLKQPILYVNDNTFFEIIKGVFKKFLPISILIREEFL